MSRLRNVPGARDVIEKSRFCVTEPERYPGKWNEIFENDHPIHVEIGMGKGKFLMRQAMLNPQINYVGIEMYSSVLVRAIEKAQELETAGLYTGNFRFIRMDARELAEVFQKGEIRKIYLNFSDPWPKERHAKRRLTSIGFLKLYDELLPPGATIEFKTDNTDLFAFSLEEAQESPWKIESVTWDLYSDAEQIKGNVPTEYEEKFVEKGNKICKLVLTKQEENKMDLKNRLIEICGAENVLSDEPLNKHTSFRTGGPADFFVTPENEEDLEKVLRFCKENGVRHFILGNGTNVLADDKGYRGVVIQVFRNFSGCTVEGDQVYAGAGILLSALSSECAKNDLTGFEFASGIPGTLGGAVTMNAGAYGGEMKDVLTRVKVLDRNEGIRILENEECAFGYRTSIIKQKDLIVLGAWLQLAKGDPEAIRKELDRLKEARTSKQPLEYPSAGSTFKRPEGYFAGKLIQDSGLAGYSIGGAQISEKHCGFIINKGGATSTDIKELMKYVAKVVQDKYGVELEKEVRFMEEEG